MAGTIAAVWASDIDSASLLSRVQSKVRDNAKRIPRYVCRQQIERQVFVPSMKRSRTCGTLAELGLANAAQKLPLRSADRVKLDVMLGEGTELFSWPGGRRFDANDPGELVPGGFSGSGDFASFVLAVFSLDQVTFEYLGACDGASCAQFGYDVPLAVSGYVMKTPFNEVTVGYHGTFDVDSQSANLLRMTVIPTGVPAVLPGACDLRTQMTYTRTIMDAGEFTIPESTEKEFLSTDGAYYLNRSSYEGCRQYTSESTLTFGDDASAVNSPEPAAASAALPVAGGELQLRLATKIDSESSGAGDALEATLAHSGPGHARRGDTGRYRLPRPPDSIGESIFSAATYHPCDTLRSDRFGWSADPAHIEPNRKNGPARARSLQFSWR